MFRVPETDVAFPCRTPVRVPEFVEEPPFGQRFVIGPNDSLNWVEHDDPDGVHCTVRPTTDGTPAPAGFSGVSVSVLEPERMAL